MSYYPLRLAITLFFLFNTLCYANQPLVAYGQTPSENGKAPETSGVSAAALNAPTVAAFPFFDDFETGVIGADWTTNSWGSGRAEISSDAPHSAANHIFLGQKVGGQSGASLELLIDLSSQTDASLDFWWRGARKATNDENGVYISDDGKNWKKVANLNGNPPAYGHFLIDIDKAAAANGLTLNRQFHIRFYYHSQWDFEEGGAQT